MSRFRSILALVLVVVTLFLTSCSSVPKAKGPLYSPEQLTQIQSYLADVQELRDQLLAVPPLVQQEDWNEVISFIHGPLGELRIKMSRLARSLAPEKTQKEALEAAKDVFTHLNEIDEAAQIRSARQALRNYNAAIQDFETFLKFVPPVS